MSSSRTLVRHVFDVPEEICYVQCGLCSSILVVCVPCTSMSMAVLSVRCGHCSTILSVNMIKPSFLPSLLNIEDGNKISTLNAHNNYNDCEEANNNVTTPFTTDSAPNKPPEKKQRTPSAYNCFIKEEIKRLKAENPEMAHKEAFSTAAKNWANFPPSEYRRGDDEIDEERSTHTPQLANNNKVNIEEGEDRRGRKNLENSMINAPFK
ncbi:axial regulator YABBY 4 isoform X2 [Arachis duranensis]|uniref:Axial regulator YABBY 4 isoform X2 n=1 Tax=Arachis duranensis TaxID=130453 RepID=A0A6P4CTM2_ARADU|nr:axial regulator YABBY 4 isoform X2 [Arachis duranensis]XP_025690525.1 axial regulator YABBY 4 isoform X2 [Arachis hypogaea]QHO59311.1 Axial regulator YABBY [Arachis hypogaea]